MSMAGADIPDQRAKGGSVRDPIVGTARGERVVWEYPILTLSMAASSQGGLCPYTGVPVLSKLLSDQPFLQSMPRIKQNPVLDGWIGPDFDADHITH